MVIIRLAEPGDVAALEACVRRAYMPYVVRMGKEPAPMLDDYDALTKRNVVTVAMTDRQLAGLIVMWPKGDHFYIDNIAVDPSHHGKGIGQALLGEADRVAAKAGHHELRLYTNEHMTENLDFYPKRGFTETHRGLEAGYERVYFSRPVGKK